MRGLNIVKFSSAVEDRSFLKKELPENYGTKLTTDATEKLTIENFWDVPERLRDCMEKYKDLHIVFSLRHPLDIFMSQLVRGQPRISGGDTEGLSDTGTWHGALLAIAHAYITLKYMEMHFKKRLLVIKMEDLVMQPKHMVEHIADYFKVEPTQEAYEFYKHNRNRYQTGRYGDKLDTSVVNIHHDLDGFGDGYFKERKAYIDVAFLFLSSIIKDLGYETWKK